MSDDTDAGDIEEIRERKKAQLRDELGGTGGGAAPVHVESPDHFAELTADGVVLVDFYADWCGPCKMLEPTVESIAAETDAAVAKVDIDRHQGLAQQHNVQGVPTLILFADGQQVEQVVGVQDEASLRELVTGYT